VLRANEGTLLPLLLRPSDTGAGTGTGTGSDGSAECRDSSLPEDEDEDEACSAGAKRAVTCWLAKACLGERSACLRARV
jgi:hypothetical protein